MTQGVTHSGELYVMERVPQHDGHETVLEMLNRREAFFAFRPEAGEELLLVSKVQTVSVSLDRQAPIADPARLRQFCEEMAKLSVVLVDEAYYELVEDSRRASMVELVRKGANVIVARTFSKIFGLAGLRVGYGIAKPETIAEFSTAAGMPICASDAAWSCISAMRGETTMAVRPMASAGNW